jgi:glycosyltransferase involved in cell wall biosynthesis
VTRPITIVHIAAPGLVGGLERVVQGLAAGHHRRGHAVSVISVIAPGDPEPHPFSARLRRDGVTVHELRYASKDFWGERRAVRGLLRQIRPDVVHTHGYRPDILHATTARGLSIATVTTEHGSSKLGGKTVVYEWLQRRFFRRFQAVVAVSSPIAERLAAEGVSQERVRVVPNGWAGGVEFVSREEARGRLGLPIEGTVIGYVGRLIPAKGPDVFAEAFLQLDDPGVSAVMIGDGSERPVIEAMSRESDAGARLMLAGHRDDAAPLFKAFDLFVLSSRTEGTPIVLFEALSAGIPTIVTAVGGVPDVVSERESRLVPSEEPSRLAQEMREALGDPEGSAQRATRALERLRTEFSAERWLSRHEAVYRSVIELEMR